MSPDNRILVMNILDVVRVGLGPYVLIKYRQVYGDESLRKLVENTGRGNDARDEHLETEKMILESFDVQRWLRAITNDKQVFGDELGVKASMGQVDFDRANAINFAYELISARNVWAHSNAIDQFADVGVYRIAENAARLLSAVGATKEGEAAQAIMRKVGKRMYSEAGGETASRLAVVSQQLASTKQELKTTKTELSSVKRKHSSASKEKSSKQRELTASKRKLTEARKDLKAIQAEMATTKKQLATAEKRLRARTQELADIKRELAVTSRKLESQKKDSRALQYAKRSADSSHHLERERNAALGVHQGETANGMQLSGQDLRGKDLCGKDLSCLQFFRTRTCPVLVCATLNSQALI